MKINDFPTLYINLDHDKNRNEMMIKKLSALNFKYKRIRGINGKKLVDIDYRNEIAALFKVEPEKMGVNFWTNRSNFKTMCKYQDVILGKVGCFLSHILALKTALDMELEKVLILEDDVDFLENILEDIYIPVDADIYFLGGHFWHSSTPPPKTDYIKIDTNKFKVGGTFGYIIPNREKILEIYNVLMSVFKVL